jgi:hypothetical protein
MALASPSSHPAHRRSSGPSLTGGCVVRPAQPVLRPPPTPTRPAAHFPVSSGYRARRSDSDLRRLPGRGGPPQFPPSPSERSAPHTPESPWRLHVQALHRFHGLHPDFRGSALPVSHPRARPLTTRQASRDATDRSVASPMGLLTLGFDPGRFQTRAASLLPGLLAATRTGLTPAGDDELVVGSGMHHLQLAGRTKSRG